MTMTMATHRIVLSLPSCLLVLSIIQLAQAFDYEDIMGARGNERCKPYTCDDGYEPVPKKKHEYQSAGCNAMGGGGAFSLFGDDEEEPAYESCCHQFHACYQICGTLKRDCDKDYKQCVEEKCKATDDYDYCMDAASQQTMMLLVGGCKQHEVEQSKHCACTTKYGDRHLKAREESLKNFYLLNAPESRQKAKELIKKADTAPKLGKLLMKLVKKYPNSIEIVEDPQTKMYRKMFGGYGGGGRGGKDGDEEEYEDGDEDETGGWGGYGGYDPDDIEDFDVNEDLGSYGEDEEDAEEEEEDEAEEMLRQAEILRIKAEKLKREKEKKRKQEAEAQRKKEKMEKKKKPPPPPPVEEKEEEPPQEDEFNQYQEL